MNRGSTGATIATVVAALAPGCGRNAPAPAEAVGSCSKTVVWHGTEYLLDGRRHRKMANRLGIGVTPACQGAPRRRLIVRALRATPPAVAVGVEGELGVWLALGYPEESEKHPLHRLYYPPGRPRMTGRCRKAVAFRGKVVVQPFRSGTLRVVSGGREVTVLIYAQTAFVGLESHGVPFLKYGQRVEVHGRRCSRTTIAAQRLRRG